MFTAHLFIIAKNSEVPIRRRKDEQWCIYTMDTNYTNGFSKKGPTSLIMNLKNTMLIKEVGLQKVHSI